jgi:hypothetical protein
MSEELNDKLDHLLRDHLARKLDAHAGGAARLFEQRVLGATAVRPVVSNPNRAGWFWPSVASLAAGVAIAIFVNPFASVPQNDPGPQLVQTTGLVGSSHAGGAMNAGAMNAGIQSGPVAQGEVPASFDQAATSWWATYDDGIVNREGQAPARRLRHVQFNKRVWLDERGQLQEQITTPQQDVVYIDLPSN